MQCRGTLVIMAGELYICFGRICLYVSCRISEGYIGCMISPLRRKSKQKDIKKILQYIQ